jgi:hypothetical protein
VLTGVSDGKSLQSLELAVLRGVKLGDFLVGITPQPTPQSLDRLGRCDRDFVRAVLQQ